MESRSEAFINEAIKKLEIAKEELLKPGNDIVSFSVCKNSQFAVENFLKGFLIKNNMEIDIEDTIGSLYEKCLALDKNFKDIDMSVIGCKDLAIDSRYCSEVNKVSVCFNTADDIDTYLKKSKFI